MMRRGIRVLAIAALVLIGGVAGAWAQQQCDFVTGGGDIITTAGGTHGAAKANFGVGGSCKQGGDDHGLWGHLEYIDHGTGLNVHWNTVTGYFVLPGPDSASSQPTGSRRICGTARTNRFGDVDWLVEATDKGEPGKTDAFRIKLSTGTSAVYDTGSTTLRSGNIQLHKPNNSTVGPTSTLDDCPALSATSGSGQCEPGLSLCSDGTCMEVCPD